MNILEPRHWLFLIPIDDNTYIFYAPMHRLATRVTKAAKELLIPILDGFQDTLPDSTQKNEIMRFLAEHRLLEAPPELDTNVLNVKIPPRITISLTNKCNLRCIYCYANAGYDPTTMSWEIAKDAIDKVIQETVQLNSENFGITFHGGGESLVEMRLLRKCVAYIYEQATKYNLEPGLSIVTNATLITKEVANWMKEHFKIITVSFDGFQDVQDYHRPFASGRGSYQKLLQGISNLKSAGLEILIRATVTNYNVEQLAAFVEFLSHEIFTETKHITIHLEPVTLFGRATENNLVVNPQAFIDNYILAREMGKKNNIRVICSYDTFKQERLSFCGASRGTNFCVTPTGDVSACTRVIKPTDNGSDLFFFAKHDSTAQCFIENQDAKTRIRQYCQTPDFCSGCFARWNCQGHCHSARYSHGEQKNESCFVIRQLLQHDIEEQLLLS